MGRKRISLSKKIKNSVKSAVKFINDFETVAAEIAIENEYDYVVCGHIHQPEHREIKTDNGSVNYLNSGDWVENLTALEYQNKKWSIYHYEQDLETQNRLVSPDAKINVQSKELFAQLVQEFIPASA